MDPVVEKFLEEKLAEVQKQLEALSKLPSTLQSTIDALNKQIASLVSTTSTKGKEEISEDNTDSENDKAEQAITEESIASEIYDNIVKEEQPEQNIESEEQEQIEEATEILDEETNTVVEQEITDEEKEVLKIQQKQIEKQQKEQEVIEEFKQRRLKQKPTLLLKPVERPIILPGGLIWSQPDDACPVVRQVKMSDEKIANTIETYSEVIVGKTKDINFLKYQPPAKNLDYLQRSDVYRLVHDMEPPVRGISSRASKILVEQDYYQAG